MEREINNTFKVAISLGIVYSLLIIAVLVVLLIGLIKWIF